MADFPGVDYRSGLIGDGFSELDNTSHRDHDVLRRRPGYERRAAVSGISASPFAGQLAVQASDNTLRLVDLSNDAVSASKATLSAAAGCFVRYNGRLYWSNGAAGPFVLDDTSSAARTPGLTAPASTIGAGTVTASAGSITAGAHLFRYRYKNSTTGYLSNPSGVISKTLVANDRVTFSIGTSGTDIIRSVEAFCDKIVIEATLANASAFYFAYEVANSAVSSINFDYSDIQISARPPTALYGDDGHNPMPQFEVLVEHRSRMFGIQASTRLLAWSRPGYPESWDITYYSRKLSFMETGDEITGAASFLGDLYIFNRYGMGRFTYSTDPSAGTVMSVPTDHGVWNQRCLVSVNNTLYGFGPGGVWQIRAMNPELLSEVVNPFIESTMDVTQYAQAFGWYNQEDRSITWLFVPIGGSAPTRGVTYSVGTGKWSTRTYKHGIVGGVYAYQKNYLFANSRMWRERLAWLDGPAAPVTATASVASSGTTLATTETMADYIGMHLTYAGTVVSITGYGVNSLTLSAALTIPKGGVAFVGALPVYATTDWIGEDLAETKNPAVLMLEFEPMESTRTFGVQVFQDFSTSPTVWYRDIADTPPAGVEFNNGDTTLRVRADGGAGKGYVPVPMPSQYARCVQFRLGFDEPTSLLGLIAVRQADRGAAQKTPGSGE